MGKGRKLLIALLLLASSAQAETVKVNLLVCTAPQPYGFSRPRAVEVFNQATARIQQETGVVTKRMSLIVHPCNLPQDYHEIYSGRQFGRVMRFFRRAKVVKPDRLNLAILPAISDGAMFGIGGASSTQCGLMDDWNLSIVAITPFNQVAQSRSFESPYVIEHELLHLLGCSHSDGFEPMNVMNSNPLPYLYPNGLPIGALCKEEIRECREWVKLVKR